MPLPSPSINFWYYNKFSKLSFLKNRASYFAYFLEKRVSLIKEKIFIHRPRFVVFYGFSYIEHWQSIASVSLLFPVNPLSFNKCKILSPNQLTFREQQLLYNLINDPKLSHLSIRGLQYHAYREGIITCGYDTWRKYTKLFGENQRTVKRKIRKYKLGIRAKFPNEIWHIDIIEFRLKNGRKVYLQAVMDNYSRKIVQWKLSEKKNENLSISTVMEAISQNIPEIMLSDGGGENIGEQIRKIYFGKNIKSLIAKKDVLFSNSMIESFFRTLKMRYICKYKKYNFSKVYKLIKRSVLSFNSTPIGFLYGARPNELYKNLI